MGTCISHREDTPPREVNKMRFVTLVAVFGLLSGVAVAQRDSTSFWLFWGDSFGNHAIYNVENANDLLNDRNFNPNLPTVIYAHGWKETPWDESVQLVIGSYLQHGGYNTIFLDWSELASPLYVTAVSNIRDLGPRLAQVLVNLFDRGLNIQNFHLVGHSLGGQLSGNIGRNIQSITNRRLILPRISCLDPAGPLWYGSLINTPVSASDAVDVDVIQTDSGIGGLGALRATGSVDFWPNAGVSPQPGCSRLNLPTDLCSHHKSWRYWSESLTSTSGDTFLSVQANSWRDFTRGRTQTGQTIQMGVNCPPGARGNWYLQTNGAVPLSRGANGIVFS